MQPPESPRPDDGLDHPDDLTPVSAQLMGHHTYEFLDDGRRVGFDRRDGSVTVYAGGAWQDPFTAGFARPCSAGGWELHDGHSNQLLGWAGSRKQAARRIAEHAQPQLAMRADRRAGQAAAAHALDERI